MSAFSNGQLAAGVALVGVAVWLLRRRAGELISAVSPLNNENIFIEGLETVAGEDAVATIGDYLFGGIALLNPWADDTSKNYARDVYGVSDEAN